MAEGPGLSSQTIEYSALVRRVAETSVSGLKDLCETSPELSDTEKKLGLLKYIDKTRQQLLRLVALTKWCRQIPLVEQCQQLAGTLSNHDMSFTQAADFLFYLHETLQQARAPVYDVPAASEILVTGNYKGLPKCVDDLGMQPVLVGEQREAAVKKLNAILRTRLLDILLPKQITDIKVTGGRVVLKVAGEFEVHLTLGYRGHLSFWRVLKLDILVGEPSNLIQFTDPQAYFLGDELERRMAASEDPLGLMYSIMNQFCTALVMDTLFRQINVLQGGRWRDTIKFEKLSDIGVGTAEGMGQAIAGQGTGHVGNVDMEPGGARKTRGSPGLKILYWLERQKGEASASLRIEHGSDQQVTCLHSPAVIDPSTGAEADFVVDSGCINVEKLLLRAITCSIHTRLLEVQRGLQGCVQLWQSDDDVVLRRAIPAELENLSETTTEGEDVEKAGEEVLYVRAFGVSYMALGISIRNGRFLLRCPSTVLAASTIKIMEDELNLATVQPLEVFVNLRIKCLLHYFGLIGRSLNLKLYERGASAVKFPPGGPKIGGDVLLMGFPHCDDSFFLLVQFDSNFTPSFSLLEAQQSTPLPGRTTLLSSTFDICRWMKIEIEARPILQGNKRLCSIIQTGYEANSSSAITVVKKIEDEECGKFGVSPLTMAPNRASGPGLDGMSTGMEMYLGVDKGGSRASYRGNMLAVQPLLHLQGVSPLQHGSSPLQHGYVGHAVSGSPGLTNPSITATGYQGKSLGGSVTFEDGNPRPGWHSMVNGASNHSIPGVGPLRGSIDIGNQLTSRKALLRNASEQEVAHTRSPLAMGDNAASPIELDYEHISKLIDSISSKTPGSFTTTDSSSRHGRHIPQLRNGTPPPNSRPGIGNVGSPSGSQLGRVSGLAQANSPGWNSMVSPSVPFNADLGSSFQEWMDLEHSGRLGGGSESLPMQRSRRKRSIADLYKSLSSLQAVPANGERKERRTGIEVDSFAAFQPKPHVPSTIAAVSVSALSRSFSYAIQAANQWKAPAGAYRAVFQQVEERCRLCIKHARLTRQMDAQRIPYVNEVGLREPSTVLRFRLPATVPTGDSRIRHIGIDDSSGWQQMSLYLGNPGSEGWDVKVLDTYISGLWKLQKQCERLPCTGEQFTSPSLDDSHMQCTHEGLVLKYSTVQDDSVTKLVTDLERIWRARMFSIGIRRVLGSKDDEEYRGNDQQSKGQCRPSNVVDKAEVGEKKWEVMRRVFRVEAVGLTCVSFTYVGSMPGLVARFVVEWGTSRRGCTVHSPEQLWPHTKFLEDYINGGEVELLLDVIQVTAGPLHALATATRPARMAVPSSGSFHPPSSPSPVSALAAKSGGPAGSMLNLYGLPGTGINLVAGQGRGSNGGPTYGNTTINNGVAGTSQGGLPSNTGRSPGTGLVPSSLLPTDVSVLLRSAYWVRIVYRREFAIDMRCFAGDQVWLQPAPPPRNGGKGSGGSLPCPQFRTFVVEHVTQGMNSADTIGGGTSGPSLATGFNSPNTGACSGPRQTGAPANRLGSSIASNSMGGQGGSVVSGALRIPAAGSGLGSNIPIRGELNPALVGMGDDGGYGGAWVPLAALKKVLRGTLRYLGGLWLFAQFPNILKEVLASTLNTTDGALLNHDPEQPALRFFIRSCMFAVSMHRQQLFLQPINVKRYQQQPALSAVHHQVAPGQAVNLASELSPQEMQDIGDFFSRRVASEPYDASRLASFVTMLTLPVPVLREFLLLIQWKREASKASGAHGTGRDASAPGVPRPRVELSLESPVGRGRGEHVNGRQDESDITGGSQGMSSIQHNQHRNTVEFTLAFSFDASQVPHLNVTGGAGWLPQSVALRLVCLYGESSNRISLMNIDVSHGGRSCWTRLEEWERCKERVAQAVEGGPGEGQGRLRVLAEAVQVTLQTALMQIGEVNFQSQQYGA